MNHLNKDNQTTLENLKKTISKFCSQRHWDKSHNPKDLAIGVVTEACEFLEIFRFYSEKQSHEMVQDKQMRGKIGEELADTLCFLLRFAQLYQFDITSCLKDKLAKKFHKIPVEKQGLVPLSGMVEVSCLILTLFEF